MNKQNWYTGITGPSSMNQDDLTSSGGWLRGSVVRTSVFGWQTFPDLYLIYD